MKSNMKRFLGLLIATLMVVTMVPVTAFADATTTGSPNVFSIVAEATGDQQTEYLLVDTGLTQNGETYYGLMTRKNFHVWYGDLKIGGTTLNFVDDDTKVSTDTKHYTKYIYYSKDKDGVVSTGDLSSLAPQIYPDAVRPYMQTLEFDIATDVSNPNLHHYTVTNMILPTSAQVKDNAAYMGIPSTSSLNAQTGGTGGLFLGTATRSPSSWRANWKYFASHYVHTSDNSLCTGYADMSAQNYNLYVNPVIYVTKDFFRNIKIDTTKDIGANVKTFLTENFYQRDFAGSPYTDDELTALGIKAQPDNATSVLSWSPYYMKLVNSDGAYSEFLYNGNTVTENGKTYMELIGTVDGLYNGITGFGIKATTVGADGSALDSSKYWYKRVYQKDGVAISPEVDVNTIKDNFPTVFKNNLRLFDDQIPAFGHPSSDWVARLRQNMTYISFPSITDFTDKHGSYLYNNITQYQKRAVTSGKHSAYNLMIYDAANNEGISQGGNANYAHGSLFPRFYVDMDVFTQVKMDVVTMGDNVKAAIAANFATSQLDHLYTAAELTAIGVTDTPTNLKPVHSANYVKLSNGLELLYLGDDANGDATFMVVKDYAGTDATEGLYVKGASVAPNGDALDPKAYMEYYLMGAAEASVSETTLDAAVLADIPAAMKPYLSDAERAAGLRYSIDSSKNGSAKTRAYFTAPSQAELTLVVDYVKSLILDNTNNKNTGAQTYSTKSAAIRDVETYKQKAYDAEAGTFLAIAQGVAYNAGSALPVFAIDKDFLTAVKVDVASLGANILPFFANYVKGDFTADYTAAEFEALGVGDFKEEVKPVAGNSKKFVVGGNTYILMDATKEINGKNYVGVLSTSREVTRGFPSYDIVNGAEFSTDNEVTISVSDDVNGKNKTAISTYLNKFTPFDGYIMPADTEWVLYNSTPTNTGVKTKIYYKGAIGVPTTAQIRAINAVEDDKITPASGQGILTHSLGFWSSYYYYVRYLADGTTGNAGIGGTLADIGANACTMYYMTYVDPDFFKNTDIDMTTAGDGFKAAIKANFERSDLTGWTDANLDILFGGYNGEGLGLEIVNGSSVVVHNNGAEAAGAGSCLIVASYAASGMVDVKTFVLTSNVSAGAKTSAIDLGLDTTGATNVKAMLWDSLINVKPLTGVVSAN